MAAKVLASHLRLDVYRINLSAVVSKDIGEVEKNLSRMFDAAEGGGPILFFDEADPLFGNRSEVKDAHDRYANIEINYLLQRMEACRGLAILATNTRTALDTAFLRRLRFIVSFPFPGVAERGAIWEKAFPPSAPRGLLDFQRLAGLQVSGGITCNIALNAPFWRPAPVRRSPCRWWCRPPAPSSASSNSASKRSTSGGRRSGCEDRTAHRTGRVGRGRTAPCRGRA